MEETNSNEPNTTNANQDDELAFPNEILDGIPEIGRYIEMRNEAPTPFDIIIKKIEKNIKKYKELENSLKHSQAEIKDKKEKKKVEYPKISLEDIKRHLSYDENYYNFEMENISTGDIIETHSKPLHQILPQGSRNISEFINLTDFDIRNFDDTQDITSFNENSNKIEHKMAYEDRSKIFLQLFRISSFWVLSSPYLLHLIKKELKNWNSVKPMKNLILNQPIISYQRSFERLIFYPTKTYSLNRISPYHSYKIDIMGLQLGLRNVKGTSALPIKSIYNQIPENGPQPESFPTRVPASFIPETIRISSDIISSIIPVMDLVDKINAFPKLSKKMRKSLLWKIIKFNPVGKILQAIDLASNFIELYKKLKRND